MTGKGLDGCHRRTLHREVRAEGVPKNMDSLLRQTRAPCCPTHSVLDHLLSWPDTLENFSIVSPGETTSLGGKFRALTPVVVLGSSVAIRTPSV